MATGLMGMGCRMLLLFAAAGRLVRGLALGEPPDGKAYLAAWIDGSAPNLDSPALFNKRIGRNAYGFQLAQTIPVTPYNYTTGGGGMMNVTEVTGTDTTAAIFLTVYPQSLAQVTDAHLQALGPLDALRRSALPLPRSLEENVCQRQGPRARDYYRLGPQRRHGLPVWNSAL